MLLKFIHYLDIPNGTMVVDVKLATSLLQGRWHPTSKKLNKCPSQIAGFHFE